VTAGRKQKGRNTCYCMDKKQKGRSTLLLYGERKEYYVIARRKKQNFRVLLKGGKHNRARVVLLRAVEKNRT
jgi:hypothetical protein